MFRALHQRECVNASIIRFSILSWLSQPSIMKYWVNSPWLGKALMICCEAQTGSEWTWLLEVIPLDYHCFYSHWLSPLQLTNKSTDTMSRLLDFYRSCLVLLCLTPIKEYSYSDWGYYVVEIMQQYCDTSEIPKHYYHITLLELLTNHLQKRAMILEHAEPSRKGHMKTRIVLWL